MSDFSQSQKEFITDLFTKLNDTINEKTDQIRKEIKEQVCQIKEEVSQSIGKLEERVQRLEAENKKLVQEIVFLERKTRKKNIILFGVNKNQQNIFDSVLDIFNNILELQIEASDISDVYRIGSENSETCPIVVEFMSFQKKLLVLKHSYKLKGKNFYIVRDQCNKDREVSKILLHHQKKARAKGQQAYIKGEKLFIANEPYTVNQLEQGYSVAAEIVNINEEEDTITDSIGRKIILAELNNQQEEQEKKKTRALSSSKEPKIADNSTNRYPIRSTTSQKLKDTK